LHIFIYWFRILLVRGTRIRYLFDKPLVWFGCNALSVFYADRYWWDFASAGFGNLQNLEIKNKKIYNTKADAKKCIEKGAAYDRNPESD
jgi:hypothetical protein